jgi:hypothetical protein
MKKQSKIKMPRENSNIRKSVMDVINIIDDHIRYIRIRRGYSLQTELDLIAIVNGLRQIESIIKMLNANNNKNNF